MTIIFKDEDVPNKDDPGFHAYWFGRYLYERWQECNKAVHKDPEDLYAVTTADENLRNLIIANIHNEDFMYLILDCVQAWIPVYEAYPKK